MASSGRVAFWLPDSPCRRPAVQIPYAISFLKDATIQIPNTETKMQNKNKLASVQIPNAIGFSKVAQIWIPNREKPCKFQKTQLSAQIPNAITFWKAVTIKIPNKKTRCESKKNIIWVCVFGKWLVSQHKTPVQIPNVIS